MASMEQRRSLQVHPKASVTSKQIVINRTPKYKFNSNQGSRASLSMSMGMNKRASMGMSAGVAGGIAHKGVDDMKNKREGEKKELQGLNDRFATYVSQVRTLEAENKVLREQLKKKRKEFDAEPMKEIYQTEIDETKKLLDDATKENAELKVSITSMEDEMEDQRALCRLHDERIDQLQDKVNSLNDENAHRTAECEMLRRKVEELEKQVAHWKAKYDEVYRMLQATRTDLKDETNERIAEYSRAEALQEELDFMKTITDAEIAEYKAMLAKEDDTGINVRDAWNDELSKCMKDLREEYETRLTDMSEDMSTRYESQLMSIRENAAKSEPSSAVHSSQESRKFRSECTQKDSLIKDLESQLERMRIDMRSLSSQLETSQDELQNEKDMRCDEVSKLRAEMEAMLTELQMLMDAKLSLELEIAAYRKLLEGEENRLSFGNITQMVGGYRGETEDALANILEQSSGAKGASQHGDSGSTSTATGRITMQRSSKSVLSIAEIDNNGRFVIIENTSAARAKTPMNLKGWRLRRLFTKTSFMGELSFEYNFKTDCVLNGDQSVKIWAKNYEKEADAKKGDIVSTVEDWGQVNRNSDLTLYDEKDAIKATLSVKVVF